MRYKIYDHQSKGALYIQALDKIAQRVEKPPLDIVFSDQAIFGRINTLESLRAKHYFLYPHSGRPSLAGDFMPQWKKFEPEFVAAEGHRRVMRKYGHDQMIHVVGWHLCPIRKFQPKEDIKKILFAPIHPRCDKMDQDLNLQTFNALRQLDGVQITVRYIGRLADSGLEFVDKPNIMFMQGTLKPTIEQILESDIVVAHQTFAYMAVATGVPTVMFGEDMIPHLVPNGQKPMFPHRWREYHHMMRYPIDMKDGSLVGLLHKAAKGNKAVEDWKELMIGNPFNEELFLRKLENYL